MNTLPGNMNLEPSYSPRQQLSRSWSHFAIREIEEPDERRSYSLMMSPRTTSKCKFTTVYDEAFPSPPLMPVRQKSYRGAFEDVIDGDTKRDEKSLFELDKAKTSKQTLPPVLNVLLDDNSCSSSSSSSRIIPHEHRPIVAANGRGNLRKDGILKNKKQTN